MEKTNVMLNEKEVALFLKFQENYELFNLMLESGIFDIRNGKAILNFDPQGGLEEIKIDLVRYKRGKPMIPIVVLA